MDYSVFSEKYHCFLTNKICVIKAYTCRYKKDFHEFNLVMSFFFNIKQKIMWKGHIINEILKIVS